MSSFFWSRFLHVLVVCTYRYVFLRLNTTRNIDSRQPNTAAEQIPRSTTAEYSTATLSSSSRAVISHGHVWQVYMLLYCCGYLLFLTRYRSSRNNTPHSLYFFYVLWMCVIQHCHCSSRARHRAPTAAGSILCTCGRSALYSLSTTASSGVCCCCLRHIDWPIYACTSCCMQCVTGIVLLRTDHRRIAANHSYKASLTTASFVQEYSKLHTAVCPIHC